MLRRWLIGGLIAVAVLLLAGRFVAAAYVDFLWYASQGARTLWSTEIRFRTMLGVGSAAMATLFFFANLYAVRRSVVSLVLPRKLGNIEIGEEVPPSYLTNAAFALSVIAGALLALPREKWIQLASAVHSVPFGDRDPYFMHDVSFFVNWLPFERSLFVWCLVQLIAAFVLVLFLYALTPSLRWEKEHGLRVTLYVRRHLGVLGGVAMLMLAWSFRLDMFESLLHGSGAFGAFISTDRELLKAFPVATLATLVAALLLAWAMWTDQVRFAIVCITSIFLMSLGVNYAMPLLIRPTDGGATYEARERPFLATRAGFTRRAFGVDELLPAAPPGTYSFASLAEALLGVSAWDPDRFEEAAGQLHGALVAGNAGFLPSAAGQLLLAVIMRSGQRGGAAEYAIFEALSARAQADGAPRPHRAGSALATVHTPVISEPAPPMLLIADSLDRIRAPEVESMLSRLAHAWSRQDFSMLFGELPAPNPRILMHSGVRERVGRLAPFFEQGGAVYPLVHADTLFWAVHLYSHSDLYPLSHDVMIGGRAVRYYRHAATAVVNSATGRVDVYAAQPADPILQMWMRLLPDSFRPREQLASQLAAMIPPVVEASFAQATSYARYGMRRDSILAGSLPYWSAGDIGMNAASPSLVHLPALHPVSAWIAPVLDRLQRVNQLIIATGGDTPRSYLLDLAGPESSWSEIVRTFRHAADSIASVSSSDVHAGAMRALPVEGRVVLLQAFYASAPTGAVSLAGIAILEGDSLSTGAGLAQASGVRGAPGSDDVLDPDELHARVKTLYEAMRAALRRGDLAAFAEAFNNLGILLGVSIR